MNEGLHSWKITPKQAVALQRELKDRVRTDLALGKISAIAGVDVSYDRASGRSIGTVAVLSYPGLQVIDKASADIATPFPYLPGLLSFREIPVLLEAFQALRTKPGLIFVDGHGQAHPRRFGIACHLGLWLRMPTIGIGKSRLCGDYLEPGEERDSLSPLNHRDELIGHVLRTRRRVKPIFVSVGFGVPLDQCLEWTRKVTPRYRLPEPIRQAHNLAAQAKESLLGG